MTASTASAKEGQDLPPLEVGLAQAIAATIQDAVTAAARASPGMQASAEARKLVARRVPSSWLPKYKVMDEYGFVVWDEAMTILDRILVYPFTASYRKHLKDAPKEVLRAWQFHSHSLRVGELYIVLDRTKKLLEFLAVVARDCGLPATDKREEFEKTFKKTFERRLRERHRLTHAHERPSMESRIIDLAGGKWQGDHEATVEQVLNALDKMLPMLARASEAAGRAAPRTPEDVEALHEAGALQEARLMLKLVAEALLGTFNSASVASKA